MARLSGTCGGFLGTLALENCNTFTVVLCVEFFFFKEVALKYVPTPPSFFLETLRDDLAAFLAERA